MLIMFNIDITVGRYKFLIKGIHKKCTFIQGDSGTGKTILYRVIRDKRLYGNVYRQSIVSKENSTNEDLPEFNFGEKQIPSDIIALGEDISLSLEQYNSFIQKYNNTVIILDEDHPLLHTNGHEQVLKKSNNYFIIITRDMNSFKNLPSSLTDIFHLEKHNSVNVYTRYK